MVGNRLLTLLSNIFTNINLSDMETGYKVFRRDVLEGLRVEEERFGFEPEITAKLAQRRCRFFEVGISYYGRTYEEGKKIGWRDGVRALYVILKAQPLETRIPCLLGCQQHRNPPGPREPPPRFNPEDINSS